MVDTDSDHIRFSYFMYKDYPVGNGICEDWNRFADTGLKLPFDDVEITALSLISVNENLNTGAIETIESSCIEESKVKFMVEKIQEVYNL